MTLRRGVSGFRRARESWEIFTQRRSDPPEKTGIFDHTPVKASKLANILNYLRMGLET